MKTHTPGPWKPLLNAMSVCTDNSAPLQANICRLDSKSQNVDEETLAANARLIAAAPALLAACGKAEWCLCQLFAVPETPEGRSATVAMNACREAIALAGCH